MIFEKWDGHTDRHRTDTGQITTLYIQIAVQQINFGEKSSFLLAGVLKTITYLCLNM